MPGCHDLTLLGAFKRILSGNTKVPITVYRRFRKLAPCHYRVAIEKRCQNGVKMPAHGTDTVLIF